MKRSFVFVPATLIVLFLLNSSFVLKREARDKPAEEGQLCTGVRLGGKWLIDPFVKQWYIFPFAKDAAAKVDFSETGMLSIQEAANDGNTPGKRVNFSISIQRPNIFFNIPVPEYLGSVQQAYLKTILKRCYFGDVILLKISEPGKYDPNILRIKVEGSKEGC